jgi:hypothetical protein
LGGIINQAEENIQIQDQPISKMQSSNISKYWFKEPYYAARWTYFHRPSVWTKMADKGTFDWYGLSGFKTLLAGEKGIGYRGGPRTLHKPSRWLLNSGARGLEEVGKGFTKLSTRGFALKGGQYPWLNAPLGPQVGGVLRATGQKLMTAGQGFRTGGLGGAVTGLGWAGGGKRIQGFAGGTTLGMSEKMLVNAGYTAAEARTIIGDVSKIGGKGFFSGKYVDKFASYYMENAMASPYSALGTSYSNQAIKAAAIGTPIANPVKRAAIGSALRIQGAARLMAGVSVGLNIAMFGGILAKLGYAGARRIAEESWDLKMNRSAQMLEFGSGLNPYQTSGASTERSRAVQAIQESHLNSRTSLGREAEFMSDNY